MKSIFLLVAISLSSFINAADIIEQKSDGSKTIWHDDGRRVDYDAKGKVV